jgi:hypothetical protein
MAILLELRYTWCKLLSVKSKNKGTRPTLLLLPSSEELGHGSAILRYSTCATN